MSRFAPFVFLLVAMVGSLFAVLIVEQGKAEAGTNVEAPTVCTYMPLSFSMIGGVNVENMRPFTPSTNESYLQFAPAAPLTPTATSQGYVLLYGGMGGPVHGGISGTFTLNNLNGIAIADAGAARGFLVNNLIITDASGSMNLLFAVNFASTPSGAPFYPRFLTGYVQSISGTGAYASRRFVGTVTAEMQPPGGSIVMMYAGITGKLYEGFPAQDSPYIFSGSRMMIPNKPVTLQTTDVLARFFSGDMQAGGTNGNVNPVSVFTGTTHGGYLTTTFELDSHSLLVGDSLTFSPGWIVGNFRGRNAAGDTFYGPWLGDLPGVSFDAYFFQAGGTGVFANSHIFTVNQGAIAYQGGQDIAGGSTGYYCTDMVDVGTATPTPTAPPATTWTATAIPSSTGTSTNTPTATGTSTPMPTQTTGGTTATPEPTQTSMVVPTATVPPVETSTATRTAVPATATATACTMRFQDVPEGSTFYGYVMCLACRGIVSGYECGGVGEPCGGSGDPYFRPGNSVTRGQVAKIVGLAAGFGEPVSGQTFEDVVPGSTFYEYVQRMAGRGIMNGYPCGGAGEPCVLPGNRRYFRPNALTTRGQAARIVCGGYGGQPGGCKGPVWQQTFEDVLPGSTFYEDIEVLAAKFGVLRGYACGGVGEPCVPPENRPYFRPGNAVTRGQTSKIVSNTLMECEVR
jgi:hypothetical protein